MAGVYPFLSLCFCVLLIICSVAGESQNGSNGTDSQDQEEVNIEDNADLNTGDARVSQRKYTSTSQSTNSNMKTSALMKTVVSFLVSTSLPVSDSSQTRSPIADHGSKPSSFINVKKRRLERPVREDVDDTSQTTLITDVISPPTQTVHVHERTVQQSNLEETGDAQQGNHLDKAETSDGAKTDYRNYFKQFEQEHPEETGQKHNLEEQRSNQAEDATFPNMVMTEINGSLDAGNQTQAEAIMLNSSNVATLPATEGYMRERVIPTSATPQSELRTEYMKNRANQCSIPLMFMWLLCLYPWIC
ncbi:hypothetical protein BsWGS_29140 [Bradybaena similaris]